MIITENNGTVRFHSSDRMTGLRELAGVYEPVAVVVRPDGTLDVYGQVGIVDQRPDIGGEMSGCVCCQVHSYQDRNPEYECARCGHLYGRHA